MNWFGLTRNSARIVSKDEKEEYTGIIDGILATADLETISRKKIRQGLETAIGRDLSEQKVRLPYMLLFAIALLSFHHGF